jgi:hypothetical protein
VRARNAGADNQPKRARALPDFSKCRARRFGGSAAVYCLADNPGNCIHALMFSAGTFCLHPDRKKFIARAQAAPRP